MEELKLPASYKKKIAVVSLWPNLPTAETEFIERLKVAARMMGVECIDMSPAGYCFKTNKKITSNEVDFAIHLHFDTPKNYDIFSFVALWNPLQFYFDFGYERVCKNLISHDDFLSCLSFEADDHLKRLLIKQALHLPAKFTMFHSLSGPIISPTAKKRNLIYIGINWEKLGRGGSRHEKILKQLEQTDYLRIYGPRIVQGKKVWGDFKSYVEEIPFDGVSVLEKIHAEGVGLVFSSNAHRNAGLMTTRLFETIAAGAVVISDGNPFARQHFGNTLLYVDPEAEDLFFQIDTHMKWINANPDAARELISQAQEIFRDKFLLGYSLQAMYEGLQTRKKELSFGIEPSNIQNPVVALIYFLTDEMPETQDRLVESCIQQDYCNLRLILVVDLNCSILEKIEERFMGSGLSYTVIKIGDLYKKSSNKMGACIAEALKHVENEVFEYFTIMLSHEEIFHNHITSLVRICARQQSPCIASTSAVLLENGPHDIINQTQSESRFIHYNNTLPIIGYARFMFSKRFIQKEVFYSLPYLNKQAIMALIGRNQVTISSLMTVRIHAYVPYFRSFPESQIEKQLLREILKNEPIGAVYARPSSNVVSLHLIEKIKECIKVLPMPSRLRLVLRDIYQKIKPYKEESV